MLPQNTYKTPEQEELDAKRLQLEELETEYSARQLEYSTLSGEIGAFRNRYYLRVGSLYAQLDTLRAEIREFIASQHPENEESRVQAKHARQQAEETINDVDGATEDEPINFQPSADIKKTYRQAAKLIHPDRARDDEDREFRDTLMAEVNAAYSTGDIDAIHEIIERYSERLNSPETDNVGAQLVRMIRNIARTRNRISNLVQAIAELQASEWFRLKLEVEQGEANGEDPLGKLAENIHAEILEEQKRLNELLASVQPGLAIENISDQQRQAENTGPTSAPVFRPEGLIHRTERGEKVRSKSEVIIANILHNLGMDYRYEYPIEGHTKPGIRRPDFVFLTSEGKPIIWEHLGMLNDADYLSHWQGKQAWYEANGFSEGIDFFITRDEADGSLDSYLIRKQAEYIKTLLVT